MDFPDTQTPPADFLRGRAAAWAALLALALYAVVLGRHVGAVASGSDSSGYMNHARLLAARTVHAQPRTIPGLPQSEAPRFLYVPLGFKPARDGNGLVPTYPSGLPLFILAARPLAGWRHAGDLVIILHALAGLAATFALGRMLGLGRPWAALGAAMVALSPLYLFMSLQAMSDVPSLVWTSLAVIAALRSRERPSWALAAGAAVAVDVLLRPANVLAFAPVAIALGASPRRWALLVAGGLPGAAFFCAHNLTAYGALATTGYGDSIRLFEAAYVRATLLHYARWLPVLLTPLAALMLALPWIGSERARTRWLLATWILAYAGFYCVYKHTQDAWWFLRFLLPAAPAMVIASLLVARALFARAPARADPGRSFGAFAVALALIASFMVPVYGTLHPLTVGREELRYELVARWMEKNVPRDAVCLTMQASGALFYYTQFTLVRWDFIGVDDVRKVDSAVRASGRPLYAVLFNFEIEGFGVLRERLPGHWTEVGKVEDVTILRRDLGAAKS